MPQGPTLPGFQQAALLRHAAGLSFTPDDLVNGLDAKTVFSGKLRHIGAVEFIINDSRPALVILGYINLLAAPGQGQKIRKLPPYA